MTEASGLGEVDAHSNGAWGGDIDNDGDPDLFVTTMAAAAFLLFSNDGRGHFREGAAPHARLLRNQGTEKPGFFQDVTAAAGGGSDENGTSSTLGDYDRDGDRTCSRCTTELPRCCIATTAATDSRGYGCGWRGGRRMGMGWGRGSRRRRSRAGRRSRGSWGWGCTS